MVTDKKEVTAVDKAYKMFGRGEWVAENGKVRETRLIKELVEYAEALRPVAAESTYQEERANRLERYLENERGENEQLNGEIKMLQEKIDAFNARLDAIVLCTYEQRVK